MLGRFFNYIYNKFFDQIIRPIIISVSPVNEVALGTGIGMFIGMTPTVGIQMWIVFVIWLFSKYVLGLRFDLIIGTAVVWVSNPFTMFFMYYGFLATGLWLFSLFGFKGIELSYATFYNQFSNIVNNPENGFLEVVLESTQFLLVDLGKPMLFGSLLYAVPMSIISYFFTKALLLRYRQNKAAKLGMDYEVWREKHEKSKYRKIKKTKL